MMNVERDAKYLLTLFLLACCSCEVASRSQAEVGKSAVGVLEKKYFIIRQGEERAAVMLIKRTWKGDGGCKYVWHYQNDGSGTFTNANAKSGAGEVFEKYRNVEKLDDGWLVDDDGGDPYIECGSLTVLWSVGNWIYFGRPNGQVEIAQTDASDINDVNYLDESLTWHKSDVLPASDHVGKTDFRVQAGKYFLVRQDQKHGAVMLTTRISKGDGGFKYVWHYQDDSSGAFTNANVKSGAGEVFNEGQTISPIVCGPLILMWIPEKTVLFNSLNGQVEIAQTNASDVSSLDYLDKALTWHKSQP